MKCEIPRGMIAAAIFGTAMSLSSTASSEPTIVGTASVIDGDTIEVHGTRIRLHGIDAPESAQLCTRSTGEAWRCGQQAALALSDRIGGRSLMCDERGQDRYGRSIAVCMLGSENLNYWMVEQGWAVAYRRYSTDYVAIEEAARAAGAGIWSGSFDMPWDYRARRWAGATQKAPNPDCPIKGNINRDGERIYHTPWGSRSYDRTKIDTAKGERWFCDEAEAVAAGWRIPFK
jgi:endonuclease YncB( thermonuclease family)